MQERSLQTAGQDTFIVLLQCFHANSPLCHNLVGRKLGCLDLPENIILVHYFDTIMLNRLSKQEAAFTLDILVTYIYTRGPETF